VVVNFDTEQVLPKSIDTFKFWSKSGKITQSASRT